VPGGAIATALALVESMHGRDMGYPFHEATVEISAAADRWGRKAIIEGFDMIICAIMNAVKPAPDAGDSLHVVLPAVLTKFHRMHMDEVPDEALPTVAGMLTAAFFGQSPYQWRTSQGPIPDREVLLWCYVAWLLVDFMDNAVYGQPGRCAQVITEALVEGEPDQNLR
jgi:hypothetical protein